MTLLSAQSLDRKVKPCKWCKQPVLLLTYPREDPTHDPRWGAFIIAQDVHLAEPISTFSAGRAFFVDYGTRSTFGPLRDGQEDVPLVIPHRCTKHKAFPQP